MPEVRCDICREQMEESTGAAPAWVCYPCNNLIYESELYLYEEAVCQDQSKSTPSNSSP